MYIIIDSSHQLRYTGMISGSYRSIKGLYKKFEKIFIENNVAYKYHWSKLSKKTKNKLKKPLIKALQESPKVNLNILDHRKPAKITKKDWYLYYLPAQLAQRLEHWLGGSKGSIELIVDNDYNVTKGNSGTYHFIEALLRQTSLRLTGKEITIRKEGKIKATIKQVNGNILTFYASVAEKNSREIGLTDIYLGLYISEKRRFDNFKNIYYKKIK